MQRTADVLIVGGGVIGCALAYFLRKRGVEVLILERGALGAQSSSAAAGLLAPIRPGASLTDPYKQLQLASLARFPTLIAALEEESGIATDYQRTGTLRLLPAEKIAPTRAWSETWKHAGFQIEVLSPEEASQREPLLSPDLAGAVFIADEAQVTPIRLVQAYAQAARHLGAVFSEQTDVVAFQRSASGQRIAGVTTASGEVFLCGQIILATGVWLAESGTQLGIVLPVYPVQGEVIAPHQPPSPVRHICFDEGIVDEDIWITPKPQQTLLIGSTKKEVGFAPSVSAGGVHHLLNVAFRLFPSLTECSMQRTWAGLRPKTAHARPLLGPAPQWENVLIAGGHGGFGILLSAITGELLTDLVVTGRVPDLMHPFVPPFSL